jgi:hypothetical protein
MNGWDFVRWRSTGDRPLAAVHASLVAVVLTFALGLIYGPSLGHGFVKDDFVWIAHSQMRASNDVRRFFEQSGDFFRPLVGLSFGLNRIVSDLHPFGYGAVNFALVWASALALALLARALLLSWPTALMAASLWAFNFHGINTAILWISGRTALLLTLFAGLAGVSFLRRRYFLMSVCLLCAMLSKEEAVALPLVLACWLVTERRESAFERPGNRRTVFVAFALAAPLVLYLILRWRTAAFTPATAPPYYHFTWSPSQLVTNVISYADRSATFSALVLGVLTAVGRPQRVALMPAERSAVSCGVAWLAGGFALTMFLPVRSSLYVCFPSMGVALIAAAVSSALWREIPCSRLRVAVALGVLCPFLLWPIYHARNDRLVSEADLSRAVLQQLADLTKGDSRTPVRIVLQDDRSARPSLNDAFGTLVQEAVDLIVSPQVRVWIEPPPIGAELAGIGQPPPPDVVLRLRNGVLEPQ